MYFYIHIYLYIILLVNDLLPKGHNFILNISNLLFPFPNMYWRSFHVMIHNSTM